MKIRTLLIDGNNLLKRSFHGAKDVYNSKGIHLGGLYSFMTTTRKLIKKHGINKVIIFFDGQLSGTYRHQIDSEYKANRKSKSWYNKIELTEAEIRKEKEKEMSLLWQKKRIQAYAEELFLRQIEVDKIEADDLIAAYCVDYNNKEEIYLFSNDRDFAQLLDLNLTIIFPTFDTPINKANYYHFFGYVYSNALIMKVICGDTSDNIKGVGGLKEKTLIKYFPDIQFKKMSVRKICGLADKLNKKRISEKKKPLKSLENLLNNIDRLKLNYKLINLREPFLNEEAIEELEQLELPLSPIDRGSKNLYKMMQEDEFLTIYNSTFVNYVEPFYSVIMNEKQLLKAYEKKNRKNL